MKDLRLKILMSLLGVAVAGIPTWLYVGAKSMSNPEGFWQNIVLGGLFLYFGGTLQLILLVALCVWLGIVWSD